MESNEFSKEVEESAYLTFNTPKEAIFLTTAFENRHIEGGDYKKETALTQAVTALIGWTKLRDQQQLVTGFK